MSANDENNYDEIMGGASPELPANNNYEALNYAFVYAKDNDATSGLVWGYRGGRWSGFDLPAGTLALTANGDNYMVVDRSDGTPSMESSDNSPPAPIKWDDTDNYARVYKITMASSVRTGFEDHRAGEFGIHGGSSGTPAPSGMTWNHQTDSYTLVLGDAENAVAMDKATANTLTIPTNASVAFDIGTKIIVMQENIGATLVSPAGGVTLRSFSFNSPPSTTLGGRYAMVLLVKRDTNEWIMSGANL